MRKSLLFLLSVLLLTSCTTEEPVKLSTSHLNLTPHPQHVSLKGGELAITNGFAFKTNVTDSSGKDLEGYLKEIITFNDAASSQIQLIVDSKFSSKEGYSLLIDNNGITI